ncbi:MAG: hypothetical protein ACYCW6_21165, partial [Candidatus Xenobia bacterium]
MIPGDQVVVDESGLEHLFHALREAAYRIIGPRLVDGAIAYTDLESPSDLPIGWSDELAPGRYRIREGPKAARFAYAVGPTTWKRYLHVPHQELWTDGFVPTPPQAEQMAFLGVRGCELAAMRIQDRVLRQSDPHYTARRDATLVLAVNCSHPAATCFCTSMGCGPRVQDGFDLAFTELQDDGPWRLLVDIGTLPGAGLLTCAPVRLPGDVDRAAVARVCARSAEQIKRQVNREGLRETLYASRESPRWEMHAFLLHAPDFLGYQDVVSMAADHGERVAAGLRLKKTGNAVMARLGGREIHPINVRLGGFYRIPGNLCELLPDLRIAQQLARDALAWMGTFSFPVVDRPYTFVALRHPDEYPMNEGRIVSNHGMDIDVHDYEAWFVEEHVERSTALQSHMADGTVSTCGPLARVTLNFDRLPDDLRREAEKAGLTAQCT